VASLWSIDTAHGKLTINSINMHTAAWLVTDVRPLYIPQQFRSGNVVIPGAAGQRAYKYRVDEANHSLPMYLTGLYTSTGGAQANRFTGLRINLETLRAGILTPPTTAATLAATITSVPGTTKTYSAGVQVEGIELGNENERNLVRAVLHLRVPAGRFST
jgi:hypothetical protein